MNYDRAVFHLLTQDGDVFAIVGARVYPTRANDPSAFPYIVFTNISNEPQNEKHRASTVDIATFQVSCYTRTVAEGADLAEKVRNAMEKRSGKFNGVDVRDIVMNSGNKGFDEDQDVHHIPLDFDLFIKR